MGESEDENGEKAVAVLGSEDTVQSETKRFLWKALCRYKSNNGAHAFLTSDVGRSLLSVCSDKKSIPPQLLCQKCKRFLQLGAGCTLHRMPLVELMVGGGAKNGGDQSKTSGRGRRSKLTNNDRRRATRLVKNGKARLGDYTGEQSRDQKLRKHEQRLLNRISRLKTRQSIENAVGLRCHTCKTVNRLRPTGKKLAGKLRPAAASHSITTPYTPTNASSTNQNESLLNESTNQNRLRKKRRTLNAGLNLSGVCSTPGSASAAAIDQSATTTPSRLTPLDVLKSRLNFLSSETPAAAHDAMTSSSSTPAKFSSRNSRLESMMFQHGSSQKKPKSDLSAFLESLR